jgi:hypothetical protein
MRGLTDQPTTSRLNRSSVTARYSQPSSVQIYVMSDVNTWLGLSGLNCRFHTCFAGRKAARAHLVGHAWRTVGKAQSPAMRLVTVVIFLKLLWAERRIYTVANLTCDDARSFKRIAGKFSSKSWSLATCRRLLPTVRLPSSSRVTSLVHPGRLAKMVVGKPVMLLDDVQPPKNDSLRRRLA